MAGILPIRRKTQDTQSINQLFFELPLVSTSDNFDDICHNPFLVKYTKTLSFGVCLRYEINALDTTITLNFSMKSFSRFLLKIDLPNFTGSMRLDCGAILHLDA